MSSREAIIGARQAAEKEVTLDPDEPMGYSRLGYIKMVENDLPAAAQYYERALALDPTDFGVLSNSALLLQGLGRLEQSLLVQQTLVQRDPVNPAILSNLGILERMSGRYDESIATLRTLLNLNAGVGDAHAELAMSLLLKGDAPASLTEIQQERGETFRMMGLPIVYFALGRKADSDQALNDLIAKHEKDTPAGIARAYAFRGQPDQAFEWLDKAVQYGDINLNNIASDNLFDKIHSDPRWLPFLRKIGKAPDQLAKIQFRITLPK